jgi:regulator of protease activity HflC (stomatin/prohibitin superfamily)
MTSIFGICVCVREKNVAILNQFGRFKSIANPGCHLAPVCCGVSVAGQMTLRVRQLDFPAETKTKDDVFVTFRISVQYHVEEGQAYNAFFKLADPARQIGAYVCDVVRSTVPKLNLDEVFETKEEIALAVKDQLSKTMSEIGYIIKEALVTDIEVDSRVKNAMNEINAAQRLRMAAVEKAEAEKITAVKQAEAEAESKHLQGLGLARQRKAISDGMCDSVAAFDDVPDTSHQEVMDMLLITQYFDTLKELGVHSMSSTIFLPHSPGSVQHVAEQIRSGSRRPRPMIESL